MPEEQIPQIVPFIGLEEIRQVEDCFRSKWLTEGPKAKEFQILLNRLMDVSYSVFAPNGTLALVLGLMALGVGPGDEVLVPDITFAASAMAVSMVGATPVFVDVSPHDFQIDVIPCEMKISSATRAIMPVHLFGMVCEMDEVMTFAIKHGLFVIEDAAQAVGLRYKYKHAGTFGDVGCFSFYADKTITTGEGGFVVCNRQPVYDWLLTLRNVGRKERGQYVHPAMGYNLRITDMQAAVGIAQMKKLPTILYRKRRILEEYKKHLEHVEQVRILGPRSEDSDHVPFRVVILCEQAEQLMVHLEGQGIQMRRFFYPMHLQPCFGNLPSAQDKYPVADYGYKRGLLLPAYPSLKPEQIEHICAQIWYFYNAQELE